MRPCVLALLCLPSLIRPAHAQWQLQDAHTTADLRGIDNVGNGVAWASGTDGTILRTEDGEHWQLCSKPPNGEHLDFRAIQAFDNNTAIIMSSGKGDLSRLYKTTDGCQSWKLIFTNPDKDGFWDALVADSREQWGILGDPVNGRFPYRYTDNAGASWSVLYAHAAVGDAVFAASNSALQDYGGEGPVTFVTGGPNGARMYYECEKCGIRAHLSSHGR
jgi:photosystem II stability/assembly factor-like uncharacterized protein